MRNLLLAFLSILIIGCSTNSYQPPCMELESKNLTSLYFPIALGNKWDYSVIRIDGDEKKKETYELELCEIDTIYYVRNGERIPFEAYRACRNNKKSWSFYFVKCSDGAHLLTINDWYNKELESGWLISNTPNEGDEVSNMEGFVWRGQDVITVPSGEYQVWILEEIRELNRKEMKMYRDHRVDGNKTVRRRYYFAEGVGLIKTEEYGAPGVLTSVMEMNDFDIQNNRGGEAK